MFISPATQIFLLLYLMLQNNVTVSSNEKEPEKAVIACVISTEKIDDQKPTDNQKPVLLVILSSFFQ